MKQHKKFVEAFNVNVQIESNDEIIDYNAFPNKTLLDELRNKIIQNIIDSKLSRENDTNDFIKEEIDKTIEGYDLTNVERRYIYNLIDNEVNGTGPLTELLNDPEITEIMVNSKDEVYIELDGKVIRDKSISFINDEHIIRTIQRMIQPLGRTIDATNPMVDARLEDGSRLNAVIEPISINGPTLTIRKFRRELADIDDLLRNGTLTPYMARFLEACVKARLNIIICGGTGGGKTTLLNVLSSFIGNDERIITIEDAAELRLEQEHVIPLETKLVNYEGEGEINIRNLVINSLRMRPDRIIVGEVRGKEAFDMLQAMNTGHSGSLTTMHSNSPNDAIHRLETMILMAGMEIPILAIREYISSAIDIVVQIQRLSDGRRKVISICEVMDTVIDGDVKIKPIFGYRQTGILDNNEVKGEFQIYDYVPQVYKKIKARGLDIVDDIFER